MLKNQDNKKVYLILLLPHSTNWDEITIDLKACVFWLNEKHFCTHDFCLHWTELFIKLKKIHWHHCTIQNAISYHLIRPYRTCNLKCRQIKVYCVWHVTTNQWKCVWVPPTHNTHSIHTAQPHKMKHHRSQKRCCCLKTPQLFQVKLIN